MLSVSRCVVPRCNSWKNRGVGLPLRKQEQIKTHHTTSSSYVFYRLPVLDHRSFFVSTYNSAKATKPTTSFKEKQKQLESASKKQVKETPSPKQTISTKKEKETIPKNVKTKQTTKSEAKSRTKVEPEKKPVKTKTDEDEDEIFGITSLKIMAELSSKEKSKSQASSKTSKSSISQSEVKAEPSPAKTKIESPKKKEDSNTVTTSNVKKQQTSVKSTITKAAPKKSSKVSNIAKIFATQEEKQKEPIQQHEREPQEIGIEVDEPMISSEPVQSTTVVPSTAKIEPKVQISHSPTSEAPKKPLIRTLRLEDLEPPRPTRGTVIGKPIPVRIAKIGFRDTPPKETMQAPPPLISEEPSNDKEHSIQRGESPVEESSQHKEEISPPAQHQAEPESTEDSEYSAKPAHQKMAPIDEALELDPTLQEHPVPINLGTNEGELATPKPAHKIIQHPSIPFLTNMFQKKLEDQPSESKHEVAEEEGEDAGEEDEEVEEDVQVIRFDKQGKRKIPSRKIQNRKKLPKGPKTKMTLTDLLNKGTVSTVTSWHQQQIHQQEQHMKDLQSRLQQKESGTADPIIASLPSLSDLMSNQQSLTELQATLNAKPDVEIDEGITRTTYGQPWNPLKKQPFGGWKKEEKEPRVKPTLEMLLNKGIMTTATHLQPKGKPEGEDEDEEQATPLSLEDMKVLGSMNYLEWFGKRKLEIERFQPPPTQPGLFDDLPEDLEVEVQVHGTSHTKTVGRPKPRLEENSFEYQNEEALSTLHDADDPGRLNDVMKSIDDAVVRDHNNPHLTYWRQSFPWDDLVKSANQDVFGNSSLRPLQLEAINAAMHKQSMFLSLPTGGGKSLCFWLPAVCSPGLTVVVSPLIALIEDQLHKLRSIGIPATYLSSQLTTTQYKSIIDDLYNFDNVHNSNTTKLLYLTPERLGKSGQVTLVCWKVF